MGIYSETTSNTPDDYEYEQIEDLPFIKVELHSFIEMAEKIDSLSAERTFLGELLSEFADKVVPAFKCGSGAILEEPYHSYEDRFDEHHCFHCEFCSAKPGKALHFKNRMVFVEGL